MINGPGYMFVEIPRCGTSYVGDILIEQCNGTRLTPRHDPLTWKVDPEKCLVFTTIRKPYQRMMSLWHYMDQNHEDSNFIEWYELMKGRDTGIHIDKPYSFWTHNCDRVLKLEHLQEQLPALMEKLGFKIQLPEFKQQKYKLTSEEIEYIKKERSEDFGKQGYSMDARFTV